MFRRARWRCQACGRWGALEVHQVVKCAQGVSDFDLDRLVALCPPCHAQTDAPYARGRLVITLLGAGRFPGDLLPGTSTTLVIDGHVVGHAASPDVGLESRGEE